MDEPQNSSESATEPTAQPARTDQDPQEARPKVLVRYGLMNQLGQFAYDADAPPARGTRVVIQTSRGIEIGRQLDLTCAECGNAISCEQALEHAGSGGTDSGQQGGRILREATPDDLMEERHINEQAEEKLGRCQALIAEHGLAMKLVDCEHVFGGERIIFYFMAEGRVDFRGLVKDLAREYQTRIEMRQVGARDEARLLGDYETCGRECCCRSFMTSLKPVSMKMAKLQKATLDPSKVSGRCGRLKCCLRFEHETYEDLDVRLPRLGAHVRTPELEGTVVERQILTQLLRVKTPEGRKVVVTAEDLVSEGEPAPPLPETDTDGTEPRDTGPWASEEAEEATISPEQSSGDGNWSATPAGEDETAAQEAGESLSPSKPAEPQAHRPEKRSRRSRRRRSRSRRGTGRSGPGGGSSAPDQPSTRDE